MKGLKRTFVSAIAIGLLAGSAVGVAAQDEAADPMAPNWFTIQGVDAGPPEISEDPATGLPVVTVQLEATDERASGMMTTLENLAYSEDDARYQVASISLRLVNDGGEWVGTSRFVSRDAAGPDENFIYGSFIEMTGEGAYEGLSMFTFGVWDGLGEPADDMGFIVPTEVIPPFLEMSAE